MKPKFDLNNEFARLTKLLKTYTAVPIKKFVFDAKADELKLYLTSGELITAYEISTCGSFEELKKNLDSWYSQFSKSPSPTEHVLGLNDSVGMKDKPVS